MEEVDDQSVHEEEGEDSRQGGTLSGALLDQESQTIRVRAQLSALSIVEANETLVAEDGHPCTPSTADASIQGRSSSEKVGSHSTDGTSQKQTRPEDTTYVIRTPTALKGFLAIQPVDSIRYLRLVLLHPLESVSPTKEEEMGDHGPNVGPVADAWHQAFRLIPPTIKLIKVDMSHSFEIRTLVLGRLAQHLSTTVFLRSGRMARFEVVGATTRRGKGFIEGSMVGLKEDSAERVGTEKLRVGAG